MIPLKNAQLFVNGMYKRCFCINPRSIATMVVELPGYMARMHDGSEVHDISEEEAKRILMVMAL